MGESVAFGSDNHVLNMMFSSGPVVQSVLILLIILSVFSWAIVIAKILQLKKAQAASLEFSSLFWESRDFSKIDDSSERLAASPLSQVFRSGYRELMHQLHRGRNEDNGIEIEIGTIERALKRAEQDEASKLERGITFLASVASAAPFIGLFGTVWGIMHAFNGLSMAKSTSIQAVAPGISEALVATAIGLAAAIPAAVAYNYFSTMVSRFRQKMASFSSEFLNFTEYQS